jgi:hypothetical protein
MSDETSQVSETSTTATAHKPEPKKVRQMSFSVLESGEVHAEFGEGIEPIRFSPAALPEAIYPQAVTAGVISMLRSYTSRLADADRTPENLRKQIAAGLVDLEAGQWGRGRTGGAPEFSLEGETAHVWRVLRFAETNPGEAYPGTVEDDAREYAAKDEVLQKKLKATPRWALALAQVKASRAAKKAEKLAGKEKVASTEELDF